MAEEANTQAAEETQAASAEQTAGDSATQEQTTQVSQETTASETAASTDGADKGEQSKSENKDTKQEFKPVSRRSAAYRIQQLAKENAELRKQVKPQGTQEEGDENAGDDNTGDDRIAQLEATVKQLQQSVNPVMTATQQAADDGELSELFSGDKASQRAEYEPQIRKMWELPQYKDVAASDLHAMLVGRNVDSIVQKAVEAALTQAKEAEKEAKESSASGSSNTSNRTGKSGKAIADMSDEELIAHNNRVKAGQA